MPRIVNARGKARQASAATVRVRLRIKTELDSGTEYLCWYGSWLTPRIVNALWDEHCAGVAAARAMRRGVDKNWVPSGLKSKLDSSIKM